VRNAARVAKSRILFPELPSAERIAHTLRSFFANTKSARPVHAVLDQKGVLRFWSTVAADAASWGHRHLWDAFQVVELNGELSQFAVRS
jgi:hypothetical protein